MDNAQRQRDRPARRRVAARLGFAFVRLDRRGSATCRRAGGGVGRGPPARRREAENAPLPASFPGGRNSRPGLGSSRPHSGLFAVCERKSLFRTLKHVSVDSAETHTVPPQEFRVWCSGRPPAAAVCARPPHAHPGEGAAGVRPCERPIWI
ncbi:hypothetical protein EVAR_99075_1 [Eumeta japonica]|uniref:Uncharacterized protein n=1 Tax=Eumeta variegata TaxID=151549 RepID=A0A4C1ZH53_EUMVA|nr:hypothetical protein EVAR_99075_1 [Eumeta japonica]